MENPMDNTPARRVSIASASGASRISLGQASGLHQQGEDRPEYANQIELLLTLVGYAVGLGNLWRFPSLCYENGGAAFLIPYFLCLCLLGLPLFILEMGLGQMFRQGTLGIWSKLGQPRLRGVGVAATICTFLVSLYYNVILAWTIYYLGRTIGSIPSGILPWSEQVPGFECPKTDVYIENELVGNPIWKDSDTGLFKEDYRDRFFCPEHGLPGPGLTLANYTHEFLESVTCPAQAAVRFWVEEALQRSTGMDEGYLSIHFGLFVSLTIAWILVYFIIYKGVESSGKVVYVTATLPYFTLIIFFFRSMTLEGAGSGLEFYLKPDLSKLTDRNIWLRACIQIFYSLGVGFGSLIAFASYSARDSDFVKQATQVSVINCGTSIFAGFVVFPILGFLTMELSQVNPCINAGNLNDLKDVVSGPSLAFIAFPIAISKMGFGYFWAIMFFLTLFCLGIDSQFAMVESVMTVLHDAGIGKGIPKAQFTAIICGISWLCGLIFTTKAGFFWFNLFDYYTCLIAMFFVTLCECGGVAWDAGTYNFFTGEIFKHTGRQFPPFVKFMYMIVCPVLISILIFMSLFDLETLSFNIDIMGAATSKRPPDGTGFLPTWSIYVGWILGLSPLIGAAYSFATTPPEPPMKDFPPRSSQVEMQPGERQLGPSGF